VTPRPPAGRPGFVAVLLGMLLATLSLSIDLTLPSMTMTADALGVGDAAMQMSLTAFVAGLAAGQLVYGPASDRFGRRPVLTAGLGLFLAAVLGCALAASVEALIAFRALHGFAVCAMAVVARALVRDLYRDEDAARMYSWIMVVHGVAPIVAPVVGAHLAEELGWRSVFWMLAVYGAAMLATVRLFLGESLAAPDPAATRPLALLRAYGRVLANRRFVGYLLCIAACYCGLFAFLNGSAPVLMRRFGLSETAYGYVFAATMAAHLVGAWASARLVRRRSIAGMLAPGALGMAACGLVMAGLGLARIDAPAAVVVPMAGFMLAFAFIVPPAQAAAMSLFDRNTGAAASMMGFVQLALSAATGAAIGHFADGTQGPMTAAIGIASVCPIASWLLIVRPGAARRRAAP